MAAPAEATAFRYDPEEHRYYLGLREIPGLTRLLRVAGMADDFSAIPAFVLERKRQLGSAVHLACQRMIEGTLDVDGLPDWVAPDVGDRDKTVAQLVGYVAGFSRFLRKVKPAVISCETPTYHPVDEYGCTPDMYIRIERERGVLELKTSKTLSRYVRLQLTGQGRALSAHGLECSRRWVLQLLPDGNYNFVPAFDADEDDNLAFTSALNLYRWKSRMGCL